MMSVLLVLGACNTAPDGETVDDPFMASNAWDHDAEDAAGPESGPEPELEPEPELPAPTSTPPEESSGHTGESSAVQHAGIAELILVETLFSEMPDRLTGNMVNNTNEQIQFGYHYRIEYNDGTSWVTIPVDVNVIDIGLVLSPGEAMEMGFRTRPTDHAYLPGQYRVVVNGMDMDWMDEFTVVQ